MGPCPGCGGALEVLDTPGGIEVDRCQSCRGTWFDPGELLASTSVDESTLFSAAGPRSEGALSCPGCSGEMSVASASGEQLDVCPACKGIYVSKAALGALYKARPHQGSSQRVSTGFVLLDMVLEGVGEIF